MCLNRGSTFKVKSPRQESGRAESRKLPVHSHGPPSMCLVQRNLVHMLDDMAIRFLNRTYKATHVMEPKYSKHPDVLPLEASPATSWHSEGLR